MFAIVMCIYASRLLFFFVLILRLILMDVNDFPEGLEQQKESGEMFVYSPPPLLYIVYRPL